MSVPCIHYFDRRGRAEQLRLVLEDAGAEYTEVRITKEEWASRVKQEYAKKGLSPYGQIPVLTEGEKKPKAQSYAITRYLGARYGMIGKSDEDKFRVDSTMDYAEEVRSAYYDLIYQSKNYEEDLIKYLEKTGKNFANRLELLLIEQDDKGANYIVGEQFTVADCVVWELLDLHLILDVDYLNNHPTLKAYYDRVKMRENIAKYLKSGKRPAKSNNVDRG